MYKWGLFIAGVTTGIIFFGDRELFRKALKRNGDGSSPRFAPFSGRISRPSYVAGVAILFLGAALVGFALQAGGPDGPYENIGDAGLTGVVAITTGLAFIAGIVSLSLRRAHDIGWSGLVLVLGVVPILNIAFWLFLLCSRGDQKANTYGEVPPAKFHPRQIIGLQ